MLRGIFAEHDNELVEQHAPCRGLAIHQGLGVDVVARASALDHVAGEGEGRSAETDDAEAIFEVSDDAFDGLGDVAEFGGTVGAQTLNVSECTNGVMDNGTFTGHEFEGQAHRLEG